MSDRSDDEGPVPETSASEPETAPARPDSGTDPTESIPAAGAAVAPPPADRTAVLDRTAPLDHAALLERPNGDPFLDARGLTATGRQGAIFTDVSLTARLGQVVAVCGDGGDGRSSLLLALAGRFRTTGGTLTVDRQTRPAQIRRRFTVAQAGPPIRFAQYHTVASCIKETTTVSGGAATPANIHAWLDRLAVGVDTGDTFGFLPRIDQIRFAIACAAAGRTPAVVVDDADTGLDTCGGERVFEALRTVADAGQLVIAACTRTDPPADTVVDLRGQDHARHPRRNHHERNGGHQS
ncbi:ABC transporter ATP-binding protein [Glycomyces sp. NPDC047369]